MNPVQPREQCRRAGDAQALTVGSFRQKQSSMCRDVTEEWARQYKDGEGWHHATNIPPQHQKLPPACLAAPPGLQGPSPCARMAGAHISSMHPWISYININPWSIYKVCIRWSAEVTVESQERRIISALRALNPVLQSKFDGIEVL